MDSSADVIVVGAGPAGMLAAAACGRAGLRVAVVAPDPDRAWPNTYGCWVDDVADAELAGSTAATWDRVRVGHLCTGYVQRRYACVDNAAWQRILAERCAAAGVRFVRGEARGVRHVPDGSIVDVGGEERAARLVIDASGAASALVERLARPSLFQVAWGELVQADGYDGEMRWMDFGDEGSFLYAMPFGDRLFVEETDLATRRVGLETLRSRLHRRLEADGVRIERTISVERCVIPLDVPVPPPQRVVPFGAAAGMVQPSTGYLLTRLVATAPALASAVAEAIAHPPDEIAAAAREAIWPAQRLRQRAVHAFGADVVASLTPRELRAFFASFFRLPEPVQRGWLADSLPPAALFGAMARMADALPPRLWWRAGAGAASLVPSLLESP